MNRFGFVAVIMAAGLLWPSGTARAAAPATPGWSPFDPAAATEKFSKTVPLAKGGTFDLSNLSGDIVITGGSGDQVVIEAVKKGRTAEGLKEVTIEVTTAANRVEVRTRYPEGRHNINVSVDYAVTVPRAAIVIVKSISGDAKLSGLDGEVQAAAVSGNVSVASAADLRTVKSVSGDVTIQSSKSSGTMTVGSVSGNVRLTDVKAAEIQVNSVSGDVTCGDVAATRVTVKSVSGEVTFGGPLAKGGRYELTAHSGDLKVVTSEAVGFEVSASSFSGDVTSDITLTPKAGGDEPAGHGRRKRQQMHGTFGDGSAVLQLNSFSGDIRIVKK
ncbi:MAG: DUF4097 family beta strand repeat-containing protein [Acidobacteriota bacterium]